MSFDFTTKRGEKEGSPKEENNPLQIALQAGSVNIFFPS
jgi:hypothetical protein